MKGCTQKRVRKERKVIKLLGIGLFLFGTVLLVVAILQGMKESIRDVTEELSLIVGSGYAVSHKEAKANPSPESIGRDLPAIKAAPKKRALSKEADEILAMVEKEKRADKRSESKETEDKTDLISKGESEPAKNDRTDLLQSMKERPAKKKKASGGTDVLDRKGSPESQGRTDLLVKHDEDYLMLEDMSETDLLTAPGSEELGIGPVNGQVIDLDGRKAVLTMRPWENPDSSS